MPAGPEGGEAEARMHERTLSPLLRPSTSKPSSWVQEFLGPPDAQAANPQEIYLCRAGTFGDRRSSFRWSRGRWARSRRRRRPTADVVSRAAPASCRSLTRRLGPCAPRSPDRTASWSAASPSPRTPRPVSPNNSSGLAGRSAGAPPGARSSTPRSRLRCAPSDAGRIRRRRRRVRCAPASGTAMMGVRSASDGGSTRLRRRCRKLGHEHRVEVLLTAREVEDEVERVLLALLWRVPRGVRHRLLASSHRRTVLAWP